MSSSLSVSSLYNYHGRKRLSMIRLYLMMNWVTYLTEYSLELFDLYLCYHLDNCHHDRALMDLDCELASFC